MKLLISGNPVCLREGEAIVFDCAIKGADNIRLYSGSLCVMDITGIDDMSVYSLDSGTWQSAAPDLAQRTAAMEDALAALILGGDANV